MNTGGWKEDFPGKGGNNAPLICAFTHLSARQREGSAVESGDRVGYEENCGIHHEKRQKTEFFGEISTNL